MLKIATRKSPLALWQGEFVKSKLEAIYPDLKVELVKMTTQGDQILNSPLSKIGGKSLFIKELEVGIMEGRADIAVHSMKDVPYELPQGFEIGAILERESPFDAFVSNDFNSIQDLPVGARLGSCSLRRIVQVKALRPDLEILDLRGNVNTRLKKLDDGEYDAIILACSGLARLGFDNRIKQDLSPDDSLPAVGQGALGIEIEANDHEISSLIKPLIHKKTQIEVSAERALNATLQGGCSVAIGAFATSEDSKLTLSGMVGNVDSGEIIRVQETGETSKPIDLGIRAAKKLLSLGARELLNEK
ncbi:MAG: hydroxymethylbilane synthase [Candidatus Thioglobus sp. TMED218]|nr:hydroxymethylbilane synthase [Candidatus Thioglobus sp.]OUW81646.1 MAG: hydroxymethylbilane synthase [Candidatus Thioglobus sp. TMED218]